MSSVLWINEAEVYSGWHLETLFIQRRIFKAVWRKRLQQSSLNETWTKNPFWQPAKVVNSWKVRRACPPVSIQIQVFVNTWYHPPWHLHFCLTGSPILSPYLWTHLSCSALLKANGLIQFTLYWRTDYPTTTTKATDFRKKLEMAFTDLHCVASTDVPYLALKASLLQMSILNVKRLIWLLRIYVSPYVVGFFGLGFFFFFEPCIYF